MLGGLVALFSAGCDAEPDGGRALLIAVDGASPDFVRSMRAEGLLPHFEELARTGVSGTLRSAEPLLSPRIWTTVVTGRQPWHHGIKNWVRQDEDGELRLYASSDREVHAIWNILTDAGLRVGVVNWLNTHPPEKINGVMISDRALPRITENRVNLARIFAEKMYPSAAEDVNAPDREAPFTHPPEWMPRFAAQLGKTEPATAIHNPFSAWASEELRPGRIKNLIDNLNGFFHADETVARAALEIEEATDPDLLLVYLPGVDRVSHYLWSALVSQDTVPDNLRLKPDKVERNRKALYEYYRFADALVGQLMERFDDDDLVLVISDHGFEAATEPTDTPGVHVSEASLDGILYARGPGITPGSSVEEEIGILDVLPTLLLWFGLPLSDDLPGHVALLPSTEPVGTLASYNTTTIERVRGSDTAAEDAVIDQLRALGYVDDD